MKIFTVHKPSSYFDVEVKADYFEINQNGDLIFFIDTKKSEAYARGHWVIVK